jgi:hypothetical protein
LIDVGPRTFFEELFDLSNEIGRILHNADRHKINGVLERLTVGNSLVNTRFSFHSASQTYNGLNDYEQKIVQNFKDALELLELLPPDEYLTDVQVQHEHTLGKGSFSNVYKGVWKGNEVAVKRIHPAEPPVFLIPSDPIRCLTLTNLQDHIEGTFKVNRMHLFHNRDIHV